MAKSFENPNQLNNPESTEGQENIEKQAGVEVHLKEQELYQMLGSPEAGVNRIEVFDSETNKARFVVSKKMIPQEGEKDLMPEGSALTVTMQGTRRQEEANNYWEVTDAKFDLNGKVLMLKDILPEDCKLVLDKEKTNAYLPPKKLVSLNRLSEIDDVITLLHEAGHAQDPTFLEEQKKLEIPEDASMAWIEEQKMKLIANQQKYERDAWAKVHRIVRKAGWPIEKVLKNHSAKALATYDTDAAQQLMRGTTYEQFASSEQRKAMRSPEKQQEATYLKELGGFTEDVPDAISHYLDIPLDEMLKKDEVRGGKSMKVDFRVSEENKNYILDVQQYEGERNEHVNILSLTEIVSGQENEPNSISTVTITGARAASVMEGRLQNNEGEVQPKMETVFEGSLGVLEADKSTQEPTKTYQKAKGLLSNLDKETVGSRMVIETFRQMYSDAPEPAEHDEQTGKQLSLEEKVAYMKKESRLYQIMEKFKKDLQDIMSRHLGE